MQFSKEARIKTFIVVDLIFFLLEITIGYTAHSLALVADAFHMLNDIISLCVGLWAVRVATTRSSSNEYTYGWARAEILGGLINGVFLIALCLSIFLDAIQRIIEPQIVKNPKLVLIVGGVGLAFNILGLFVFHQHDHGHDHDGHGHGDELDAAETGDHEGHTHQHEVNGYHNHSKHDHSKSTSSRRSVTWQEPNRSNEIDVDESTPLVANRVSSAASRRSTRAARSGSRSSIRAYGIDGIPIHPASFRNEIITQARSADDDESDSESDNDDDNEDSSKPVTNGVSGKSHTPAQEVPVSHSDHRHMQPRSSAGGGGHSHADMNIRGMFLHVLGDALGNVGVMGSALIIWLLSSPNRYYADPVISLFITVIILKSAIPLCKETAKPLLQAVPKDISVDDIQADIESLPGVKGCHHLHVWALTPSKRIATLDVQLDFEYDTNKYMAIAKEIKKCLRGFGIHSSTIQPEFMGAAGLCQLDGGDPGDVTCCSPPGSGTATPSGGTGGVSHK